MSYIDSIEKILDSKDTTVGGTSAALMAGAMSSGLTSMVARLSVMKIYGLDDSQYLALADELDNASFVLIRGVNEDAKALEVIREAFGLPNETEEDKEQRKTALEAAGVKMLNNLRDCGMVCKRIYKAGLILTDNSDSNARSDLEVAKKLAEVALTGCIEGIKANLPLIKNQEFIDIYKRDLAELEEKIEYSTGDRQH